MAGYFYTWGFICPEKITACLHTRISVLSGYSIDCLGGITRRATTKNNQNEHKKGRFLYEGLDFFGNRYSFLTAILIVITNVREALLKDAASVITSYNTKALRTAKTIRQASLRCFLLRSVLAYLRLYILVPVRMLVKHYHHRRMAIKF
jgi:hypothetical protein